MTKRCEPIKSPLAFAFFGKAGEIATNLREDQEISVHALHLLQASLVYVNTQMMQSVPAEPKWVNRLPLKIIAD